MKFEEHHASPQAHPSRLLDRLFSNLRVDASWVSELKGLAALGPVVYVLRNRNLLDYLALEYLTRAYGLPPVEPVDLLGPWSTSSDSVLAGLGGGSAGLLGSALAAEATASVLFLKRPPNLGRARGQDLADGAAQTSALLRYQRGTDRSLHLVPVVFVWTRRPDMLGTGPLDWVFGPRQWPSTLRAAGQLLANRDKVTARIGQAVNFRTFLAQVEAKTEETVRRRLVYTLLRRLERERRSIIGPPGKPPERVRKEILSSPGFRTQLDKLTNTPADRQEALKNADQMLRKMQALPDGASHRLLDTVLSRFFQKIYAGLDIDPEGIARLRELSRSGSLVLLPSHKSYIDFLVVSYAFYAKHLPMPLIVAGENLSFFPVSGLSRHAGAFFIRRTFKGDRLYAAVVDAYVKRLMQDGYAIEVFLEGGRSRAGKLLEPKLGLLSMLVTAARQQATRPVYFVPISIGYERIIETESHQRELSGGDKVLEDASGLLGATKILRHRYGRVNLQFGECLTVEGVADDLGLSLPLGPKQVRHVVRTLGNRVMDEINRVTSATPGGLVALALLSHNQQGLPHAELDQTCRRLLALLVDKQARLCQAMTDTDGVLRQESVREAAQMFIDAGMLSAEHWPADNNSPKPRGRGPQAGAGAAYTLVTAKRIQLDTSKNMLVHFFVAEALLLTALPAGADAAIDEALLLERAGELFHLFSHEFRLGHDLSSAALASLERLTRWGILQKHDGQVALGSGYADWPALDWARLFRSMVRNFIEGYWVCSLTLADFDKSPPNEKEAAKPAHALGRRMLASGDLERPEALSRPLFQNALLAFQDLGLLRPDKGKLTLAQGAGVQEKLDAVRHRLAAYLDLGDA